MKIPTDAIKTKIIFAENSFEDYFTKLGGFAGNTETESHKSILWGYELIHRDHESIHQGIDSSGS